MKKLTTLVLALVVCAGTMFAWDYERVKIDYLYYNLDATSQTAEFTSENSSYPYWSTTFTTAIIPASVEYNSVTYSVTSIGGFAFGNCSKLTSVEIPNSVTSIGVQAFLECSNLTTIDVAPDNSYYCSEEGVLFNRDKTTLVAYPAAKQGSNYTIPNSVTSIGNDAFYWCRGLTSVEIPNSVTSIGEDAFRSCSNLTSVTIPNSVTSIGDEAFLDCTGLTSVTIGNSVTSIGDDAFNNCSSLTSVTIGNSVTSIGSSAFWSCNGLTSVTIPNSVTSIGDYAFEFCRGLTSVTIGNSVTSIGDGAFWGCTGLTSVTIPNSVTSIGSSAFYYCFGLTSVTIPNSVTSIGDQAFYWCTALTSITNYATTPQSINSNVFVFNKSTCKLYVPDESVSLYQATDVWREFENVLPIPPSVIASGECGAEGDNLTWELLDIGTLTITGTGAMADWGTDTDVPWYEYRSSISSLSLPEGLTNIGNSAFEGCNILTSIIIPNTVTRIGKFAFFECNSLASIEIPNHVTYIGFDAFYKCNSLTSLTIPASVSQIGENGDYHYNIGFSTPSITSIVVEDGNLVYDSRDDCNAIIETATNTLIMGCQNTIIPNTITKIERAAFYDCSGLTSITIPSSVQNIGEAAFHGTGLTNINIPNTVIIEDWYSVQPDMYGVFSSCENLTSVTFENGITKIADGMFANCQNLKNISIPNSVTNIGMYAFLHCTSITFMTIPNTINTLGHGTFFECYGLISVTIPNSVTNIEGRTFYDCSNLTSVTNYATTPQPINSNVFYNVDKSSCKLYVPAESVSAYQSAEGWSDFQIGGAAMTAKADPDDASAFYTTFYHGSQKYKLPVGMEAYTATINGDVLVLTKVAEGGDVIPAGTALILKSNAANLTMDATDDTPVSVDENILQGVDAATPAPANCYVLSGGSSDSSVKGIGFYRFSGTLGAHKAYLVLAPKAGAPRRLRFAFSETNTTTNVEQVPSIQVPSTKMIENGQLYIMHEGQMYDVQGSRVQ